MKNYNDVINTLKKTFIIETIDISPFFSKGNSWLRKTLKKHHKDNYSSNFRLVFYFKNDLYKYIDYPGELTLSLLQCLSNIDISMFFVILITEEDISNNLLLAKNILQTDKSTFYNIDNDVDITYFQVNELSCEFTAHNTNKRSNTSCEKLWNHLHINTNGDIIACCSSDHNYSFGNIKNSNIGSCVQSHSANSIRTAMLGGLKHFACKPCYELEEQNIPSFRKPLSKQQFKLAQTSNLSFKPTSLDIRLSNICNLKCRMCTGKYSSKIAKEESQMYNVKYNVLEHNDIKDPKQITNLLSDVNEIYFAGGEPLLMESHYQILDKLILLKKTSTKITYNTNFTTLKFKNKSIFDYWKHFSNIKIGASLDAMSNHIEYIRNGTIWETIVSNYNALISNNTKATFTITANINIFNAFNLIDSQQFWFRKGVEPKFHSINILTDPSYLSIQVLPLAYKQKLIDSIHNHIIEIKKYKNSNSLINNWNNIIDYLLRDDKSSLLGEFLDITNKLDKVRNEDFSEIFTEYKDLHKHRH